VLPEELPLTPDEIRKLIKASGHNQKELADELGLSEATVSKWVNGLGTPSRDNADKLRALRPRPSSIREWNTYVAEAKARVVANRLPPLPSEPTPLAPAVDPEVLATSVAAKVRDSVVEAVQASSGEVARAVQACAAEVKATRDVIPSTSDIATAVKAALPTARELAAELRASQPKPLDEAMVTASARALAAPYLKRMAIGAAIVVSVVVAGVGTMVVQGGRTVECGPTTTNVAGDAARESHRSDGWFRGPRVAEPGIGTALGERKPAPSGPRMMPHQPLPGQARAPCLGHETTLHGACWIKVADQSAPCPRELYQQGQSCYLAIPADPKSPSSETPRPPRAGSH